ncbi:alpha-hydroxy-acid oxidizing protein [Alphaproteobacteria bacterium]|nr:alpha-hydroxy-acid oxidizing protein [Alphaproteobacteria bacterium]MDB9870857.1 alpha-hydroxy-acid oxidizing protein [Alphaproteobacteria bacterium]MDB9871901.1 alpha-hydroxy-acid oxidizing protein [Alphaproteobacteria bacterium]MDC1209880.1 alpha-hydroxy-acid oxidizing protein [Pseudomonadota bacterium]
MSNLVDKYPRVSDMIDIAKRRMPHFAAEYLFAGTGYDEALENNRKVFNQIFLVPKYLKGTVTPVLKTKLFGYEYDAPFGMAPVGMTSLMWPGAEIALSKMSVKNNVPFALSTVACASVEEVGKHLNGQGWFQLYPPEDKAIRNDLLKRAKNAGFKTLVVTADIPASSRRERLRMAGVSVPPKNNLRTFFQAAICPSWSLGTLINGIPAFGTMDQYSNGDWHGNAKSKAGFAGSQMQRYLDWDYLKEVRDIWKGPIVLKGLMHEDDAIKTTKIVDAIYLSNHGGRQIDIAPSPLQILPDIRKKIGPNFPIIIDSGFYSGQDISKGLMLGADFVMTGRPFIIGLAALGSKGANHVHDILKDELSNIMEQICAKDIKELKNQKVLLGKDFQLTNFN